MDYIIEKNNNIIREKLVQILDSSQLKLPN